MAGRLRRALCGGFAAAFLAGAAAGDGGFRVLEGHGGPIMDVAISADGSRALTASFDNSVGLWDLAAGTVTWLEGHEAAVKAVTFIDATHAASAGDDFAIEIWDLEGGVELRRLTGHTAQVKALAMSEDGAVLASASWDRRVGLWDPATGENLGWLEGHTAQVNDVTFAGGLIYSASTDGTIRSWDPATLLQRQVLVRHGFGVTTLLVDAARGWLIYGAVDGGTRVVDLADGTVLADLTLDRRPVLAIAASPDLGQIAVGDGEGHIMVVDTADWSVAHDFRAALKGPIWALAYDADGSAVLAGGIDDKAVFWPVGAKRDGPLISGADRAYERDTAEMSNGERLFRRKCSICHTLTEDGVRRAGPSLAGIFGRRAGSYPGYSYSPAVAGAGITWTAETIDALFDIGPEHYLPGTKMPAQRIASPDDRADLIDFLRANTEG